MIIIIFDTFPPHSRIPKSGVEHTLDMFYMMMLRGCLFAPKNWDITYTWDTKAAEPLIKYMALIFSSHWKYSLVIHIVNHPPLILLPLSTLPFHLIELNTPVAIHIVHPEGPGKLFFRGSLWSDMQSEHKFPANKFEFTGMKETETQARQSKANMIQTQMQTYRAICLIFCTT